MKSFSSHPPKKFPIPLLFYILFTFLSKTTNAVADPTLTVITTPASATPPNTTILDGTTSTFIITALDSGSSPAGDSEIFIVEFNSWKGCSIGYASAACEVLCYPYNAPNTQAPQCGSTYERKTKTASTALWVVADVVSVGSSLYNVTYYDKLEVAGHYTVSAYLATSYYTYTHNIFVYHL